MKMRCGDGGRAPAWSSRCFHAHAVCANGPSQIQIHRRASSWPAADRDSHRCPRRRADPTAAALLTRLLSAEPIPSPAESSRRGRSAGQSPGEHMRRSSWGMHKTTGPAAGRSGSVTPPASPLDTITLRSLRNASASGRMSPSLGHSRPGSASGHRPTATWTVGNGARPPLGSRRGSGTSAGGGSVAKGKAKAGKYGEANLEADEVDLLRGGGERDGAFDDGWRDPEEEESAGLLGGKAKGKSRDPSLARGDKQGGKKDKGKGKARTMPFNASGAVTLA